jgi:hypothetical protein
MRSGNTSIDHVFMLVEPAEVASVVRALGDFGLTESSRRSHPGLGTSNIFFCFDNIFLEILWVANRTEAAGTELGRQLIERVEGRASGKTPFGIGFRTATPSDAAPFATWSFEPPAALAFNPIPIAVSSRDTSQPLLFRAQRAARPDAWTDGKDGRRQAPSGITEVTAVRFTPLATVAPAADLQTLRKLGLMGLNPASIQPSMTLTLLHAASGTLREIVLTSPLLTGAGQ